MLAGLRAGDGEAAYILFERYARRLIALAGARLDALVAGKIDPDDVAQSVFKSFIARYAGKELDVGGWDGLWGLLAQIAVNKCGEWTRFFARECRDVRREQEPDPQRQGGLASAAFLSRYPMPDEAALLAEAVERLMRSLEGPNDRSVLVLLLQGYCDDEVAEQVGTSSRTVSRIKRRVKEHLIRMGGESAVRTVTQG